MNMIMMYMSGSGLHIFSLMMTGMLFLNPYDLSTNYVDDRIKSLLSFNQTFIQLESPTTRSRLLQAKAVYLLMQLVVMGLGVYKVWIMGLLPTSGSDFLAWKAERPVSPSPLKMQD
jgi:ER membrane protein complex subunit 4